MENKFVNPYTFIGLSDKCNKQDNSLRETNELLSGFITYKINTKSPLFIPNTSSDKAFEYKNDIELDGKNEHKLFDFFSYENLKKDEIYDEVFFKPIIPGSEIRGVIRNIYETLTNSCLSSYDSETIVKRTREQFKAGLIGKDKNGMFYLISADDCIYRESSDFTFKTFLETRFKEGQEVHFDLVERGENVKPLAENVSDTKIGNQCAGYIIKGEDGPEMKKKENEKHNAHIFKRKKIDMKYALNDNDMGRFIYVLESYKNQPNCEDSYKEYIANFKKFKDKVQEDSKEVFFPVYFSKVVNNIYLSPACFTKEAYKNDLEIILNKYGEYNYCKNKKKLCDACNLFGMILDEGAIASKIRFSDAVPAEKDDNSLYYDEIVTLNNLSNPKPSNSEFYLKKPTSDSCFWTYDYYIEEKNGKTKTMIPEIMGRKFYWHHNKFN